MEEIITIPSGATQSSATEAVNGNYLGYKTSQIYPVGIRLPSALTTSTSVKIEYEVTPAVIEPPAAAVFSEVTQQDGSALSVTFSANKTVNFTDGLSKMLKDRKIRVSVANSQSADRDFAILYSIL